VTWISTQRGGHGAVREMIELVLRAQGRWDELLSQWTVAPSRV
jgi:3-deoxy-D-manno-octulosonate 8-phosphate phosphatase (KDO 8-P phosphatase)